MDASELGPLNASASCVNTARMYDNAYAGALSACFRFRVLPSARAVDLHSQSTRNSYDD